jgi:hypothetical protein
MEETVIEKVRRRALNPGTRTEQADLARTEVHPPAMLDALAAAEHEIGHPLPTFLRDLYLGVGNGGFGPGYGLLGVQGGFPDDVGHTLVDLYRSFLSTDPDDPTWRWPAGLVPICHFGCAIYACVDCTTSTGRVVVWDPNVHEPGGDPRLAMRLVAETLETWFASWARGEDLWRAMFPEGDDD